MTLVLREAFGSFTAWTNLGGTSTIIAGGRTGTGAQFEAGAARTFTVSSDWLTFGFAFQIPNLTNEHALIYLQGDNGNTTHDSVRVTTAGALHVLHHASSQVRATTAPGVITANTWTYVEVQIRLHDTLGQVILRVDGVQHAAVSNVDTRSGGTGTVFDRFYLYGSMFSGQVVLYDDLYLATGAGESFLGPVAFTTEARAAQRSVRIGVTRPLIDWYRSARQSVRVALTELPVKDWYRDVRQSERVAFQGAITSLRVGGAHVRVLITPTGGNLLLGYLNARVLSRPDTGGSLRLAATALRVLSVRTPPVVKFWDGAAWVTGPVNLWSGTTFVDALGVRVWNGTAFVDAV